MAVRRLVVRMLEMGILGVHSRRMRDRMLRRHGRDGKNHGQQSWNDELLHARNLAWGPGFWQYPVRFLMEKSNFWSAVTAESQGRPLAVVPEVPGLGVMVVVTVVVMVMMGSGKCGTSDGNKKDSSAKLSHGENVARCETACRPIRIRRIKTGNGARTQQWMLAASVNWIYDDHSGHSPRH
jgi:hypothetical protein